MHTSRKLTCLVSMIVFSAGALAFDSFQPKGFIQNDRSEKCWYTQTTVSDSTHFHGSLKGRMGTITFDDRSCMSSAGLGHDVNMMMINNAVTRWYSHADSAFRTRTDELHPSSMMQNRGKCIQSGKYPAIGVTVDYEISGSSIVAVRHGSAVQGCRW